MNKTTIMRGGVNMFELYANGIKVPQILYNIIFYGGIIFLVLSLCLMFYGAIKKKSKKFFIIIGITFMLVIILVFLTRNGFICGNEMFGG